MLFQCNQITIDVDVARPASNIRDTGVTSSNPAVGSNFNQLSTFYEN